MKDKLSNKFGFLPYYLVLFSIFLNVIGSYLNFSFHRIILLATIGILFIIDKDEDEIKSHVHSELLEYYLTFNQKLDGWGQISLSEDIKDAVDYINVDSYIIFSIIKYPLDPDKDYLKRK